MLASNRSLHDPGTLSPLVSVSRLKTLFYLPKFFSNYLVALEHLRDRNGDSFILKIPKKTVFLINPRHVTEVLVKNAKRFRKGDNYKENFDLLGDSLLTAEGESWRIKRKAVAPEFHGSGLSKFDELFLRKIDAMIDEWQREKRIEVFASMQKCSLEIAGSAFFGTDTSAHAEQVIESSLQIQVITMRKLFFPWLPVNLKKANQSLKQIDDVVFDVIKKGEKRAESGCPVDLLRRLIDADKGVPDEKLRLKKIRDQAVTILLAGHDTTSHALTWLIYLLLWNPEYRLELERKVEIALGENAPVGDFLNGLESVEEAIDEGLRLYPSVPVISRKSLEDQQILNIDLQEGDLVKLSPWVTQRHPEFWPNPSHFDPSRFSKSKKSQIIPGSYFPFGAGPRECVGEQFARRQMKITISRILQRCHLTLGSQKPVRAKALILPRPTGPIWMNIKAKNSIEAFQIGEHS